MRPYSRGSPGSSGQRGWRVEVVWMQMDEHPTASLFDMQRGRACKLGSVAQDVCIVSFPSFRAVSEPVSVSPLRDRDNHRTQGSVFRRKLVGMTDEGDIKTSFHVGVRR